MSTTNSNERLIRFLQATPEQQAAIDRILDGLVEAPRPASTGPLLLQMGQGAKLLGVSRATVWRMIQLGRLEKVEILPGTFRVRRADLEAVAEGRTNSTPHPGPMASQARHDPGAPSSAIASRNVVPDRGGAGGNQRKNGTEATQGTEAAGARGARHRQAGGLPYATNGGNQP